MMWIAREYLSTIVALVPKPEVAKKGSPLTVRIFNSVEKSAPLDVWWFCDHPEPAVGLISKRRYWNRTISERCFINTDVQLAIVAAAVQSMRILGRVHRRGDE